MKPTIPTLLPIGILLACWQVGAQVPTSQGDIDPPGRVARISYVSGPVSFRAAGTDAWVAAELNRPVTTGDELWTDDNARAELDLSHAFVRLDSRSSLAILNLDDRGVQISLSEGTAQVRLRRLDENDEFEVATPQAALTLLRPGDYRFQAHSSGAETIVNVRSGQIEAVGPGQAFSVRAQQQARITGSGPIDYQIAGTPPLDGFDDFCNTRDRRAEKAESLQHVSPHVIGWEDLDEQGSWRVHVEYGSVWYPRVIAPGWAPYRFGHWVWIEPWGWTWIDDAPWGFAPFHYGRWVFIGGNWGWVPGPVRVRAVYAPALVVFAGGGPGLQYHFSIGVGLGVAWFPLGPREVYIPPYRASRVYVTNVNISHTTIVNTTNIWRTDVTKQRYVNRTVAGAMTAVPEDAFVRGRPVGQAAVRVNAEQARSARIGGSAPPVAPSRASIAPESARPAPRPPDSATRRQTTVRRTPAPAPVAFDRKSPVLDRDPGRPPDPGRIDEMRREQPQETPRQRQVRPPAPAATQPAPAPAPAPPKATPRRPEQPQAPAPSPRATENRRRTIDQEHQRTEKQQSKSKQEKSTGRQR